MDRGQPGSTGADTSIATRVERDLRFVVAAVGLCALAGIAAITAVATTSGWWPTLLVATLALGACAVVTSVVLVRTQRQSRRR